MTLTEARNAIVAILAAIPDDELPKFNGVEHRDNGMPEVWYGGRGYCLGSARRGSDGTGWTRHPIMYRENGADDAILGEMVYRADLKLLENGDDPTGLSFTAQRGDPR